MREEPVTLRFSLLEDNGVSFIDEHFKSWHDAVQRWEWYLAHLDDWPTCMGNMYLFIDSEPKNWKRYVAMDWLNIVLLSPANWPSCNLQHIPNTPY